MGKYDNVDWLFWKNAYENGMSYPAIAKELNGSVGMVAKGLQKVGTKIRTKSKDTSCSDCLFDFQDPIVCYLAGLVATDGYYNAKHHYISLRQSYLEMVVVLERLKNYFDAPKEITTYTHTGGYTPGRKTNSYELFITHPKMYLFMEYFKIPEIDKTASIQFAKHLKDECLRLYLRGIFDGDGCLVTTRERISILSANEQFIKDLLQTCSGGNFCYSKRGNKSFATANWVTNNAVALGNYLYTGYPEFAFPKKKDLALSR